jgi:hypothetical protein
MPQFPCDLLCISIENKLSFTENACSIGELLCARQISRRAWHSTTDAMKEHLLDWPGIEIPLSTISHLKIHCVALWHGHPDLCHNNPPDLGSIP